MRIRLVILLILSAISLRSFAQGGGTPTYRLEGQAALLSNAVENGLSQSDHDPSLQGSFWFHFGPQFRLGVSGASVAYEGQSTHFLMRLNADLKIDFSKDTNLVLSYSNERYYKSEGRDGNVFGLSFDLYSFGVHYRRHSNFYGTKDGATSYAFSKTWSVWQAWRWQNLLGYMTLEAPGASNYFFYETFLARNWNSLEYAVGGSYNSAASQFHSAGKPALILKAAVSF